ncbi:hypothetical protein ACFLZY_00650 [Patescibacteria group bacterium]
MKAFQIEVYRDVDQQGRPIKTTMTIPDGQWVVLGVYSFSETERSWEDDCEGEEYCYHRSSRFEIVGAEPRRILMDQSRSNKHYHNDSFSRTSAVYAFVGDEPFGVVTWQIENGAEGGWYFTCARQIHKGELGRRPEMVRPQFAREAPLVFPDEEGQVSPITGKPIKARDRRRGKTGWARLRDLSYVTDLDPRELVERYFDFTHSEYPALQVLFATSREEIHGQEVKYNSWQTFRADQLDELFEHDLTTIWVRKGWASVVLYLHHFGYQKANAKTAA